MMDAAAAAHILQRTGFGPFPGQVDAAVALKVDSRTFIDAQFDKVLPFEPRLTKAEPWEWSDEPGPQELVDHGPVRILGPDPTGPADFDMDIVRNWWVNRMLNDEAGLHEKMMWTWHGIFTTSGLKASRLNPLFQQLKVLHSHALGNFRDLAYNMVVSGAMLLYLDGNYSSVYGPNENQARELMELFMLGVGTFEQSDVVAASRALSGWQADSGNKAIPDNIVTFVPENGPFEPETILGVSGILSVRDLIDALLEQPTCADFVVGRLWDSIIGGARDEAIISEWAGAFRAADFEIRPLLRQMLNSDAFAAAGRSRPRTALEWYCAAVRAGGVERPVVAGRDLFRLGQCPYFPPSVAGWPYGEVWLSPGQIAARMRQVAKLDVRLDVDVGGDDLVDACLAQCSIVEADEDTRSAVTELDESLVRQSKSTADRGAILIRALLLSPDFALG